MEHKLYKWYNEKFLKMSMYACMNGLVTVNRKDFLNIRSTSNKKESYLNPLGAVKLLLHYLKCKSFTVLLFRLVKWQPFLLLITISTEFHHQQYHESETVVGWCCSTYSSLPCYTLDKWLSLSLFCKELQQQQLYLITENMNKIGITFHHQHHHQMQCIQFTWLGLFSDWVV